MIKRFISKTPATFTEQELRDRASYVFGLRIDAPIDEVLDCVRRSGWDVVPIIESK